MAEKVTTKKMKYSEKTKYLRKYLEILKIRIYQYCFLNDYGKSSCKKSNIKEFQFFVK
jgi:hypothetical protein